MSGGFLGIEHMLYVSDLKVNLLFVASFEDEGYAVAFYNGGVILYSRESNQDTTIVLGVRKERLYRLLGRPINWSNVFLDSSTDSTSDSISASEELSKIGICETPSNTKGRMSP
jgi:hypothetical protein